MTAYGHSAGESIECLSIAIQLKKEESKHPVDQYGNVAYRVGFKIGGGIDQDPSCAPFKYPDQVNGLDFTLLTHERAVKYIKKYAVLDMLVARPGLPALH
ncbi:hypothetical protein ANCDUO_09743 [Ancylostoma duodenale]|uniref:Uncharacterized protein n=1 Tax=Ancylostoma duodenale TaxID=51022 RepID=A0A0C2CT08_9BILA|nr:hypothetical protein ANCDUO_09743 [Ancylostoma duodenale]